MAAIPPSRRELQCGRLRLGEIEVSCDEHNITYGNCIGSGGHAEIYEVIFKQPDHQAFNGSVVVKRVSTQRAGVRAVQREQQLSANHNSPHIMQFLGYTYVDYQLLLFMERMLFSWDVIIKQARSKGVPIPEPVVLAVVNTVARGLEDLLVGETHAMHRDVKPSNVLLSKDGRIKLSDLGIARPVEDGCASTCVGDEVYIPPERLGTSVRYDSRSDVWALGVTAAELCLRSHPFKTEEHDHPMVIMSNIHDGKRKQMPEAYSMELRDFIDKCLEHSVDSRPPVTELKTHPVAALPCASPEEVLGFCQQLFAA